MLASCSSGVSSKDPVGVATFQNEKRIEELDVTNRQKQDAAFLVNAMASGMLNQQLATQAMQKAATPSVRNYAQRVMNDHIRINGDLKRLADQKNIMLPTGISEAQQQHVQELTALTNTAFDKKYAEMAVNDHKDDVDAFLKMSKDAYDGDIRGFAAKNLPTLESHLDQAKRTQDEVKNLP